MKTENELLLADDRTSEFWGSFNSKTNHHRFALRTSSPIEIRDALSNTELSWFLPTIFSFQVPFMSRIASLICQNLRFVCG